MFKQLFKYYNRNRFYHFLYFITISYFWDFFLYEIYMRYVIIH